MGLPFMEVNEMTLNEKLKELRVQAGMTMEDVAHETYLSEASICRYEKGTRKIPLSYICYWHRKGGLTLDEVNDYIAGGKE